jgi:hypothetical protein
MQALDVLLPTFGLYVPMGQRVHAEDPDASAYDPAGQAEQDADPLLGLYCPEGHARQLAGDARPGKGLKVPTGQLVKVVAPLHSLGPHAYEPAGAFVQVVDPVELA